MSEPARTRLKRKDGTSIVFDAVNDIAPTHADTVTRLPVESGAKISDHIETQPVSVSMMVYHSNAKQSESDTDDLRAVSMYESLLALQKSREIITLITSARAFDNMVITSISPNFAAGLGSNFVCKIQVEEIVTAETRIVALQKPKPKPTNNRNKKKKDEGTKPTQQASEQTKQSALAKLRNWIHGD